MSKTLFDDEPEAQLKVTALSPWFGSNRRLAPCVAQELRGCRWVGIGFAGGMSEVAEIKATTIVVSDLHRHVINLARVVADQVLRPQLVARLCLKPFHPDVLKAAQRWCLDCPQIPAGDAPDLVAAENYFVTAWMGRSSIAGTQDEFYGGLPVRWNANGGDSNKRYRSAVEALDAWSGIFTRCNFTVLDVFEFLAKVLDEAGIGLYLDPPFPGPGDEYRIKFTLEQHYQMSCVLSWFKKARIVCRFYDHPLIRELYPESHWHWRHLEGRTQANKKAPEVLLLNGPSYA